MLSRRKFLVTGAAAGIGFAAYSGTHARHELQTTHVTIPIRNLPDAFVGFRIVQISDIHLHGYTEDWFLEKTVERVNALAPDLVVFTGDLVSGGPFPISVGIEAAGIGAEILSQMTAPQRFAILGNHDVLVGERSVMDPLRFHGTPMLRDQFVALEHGSDRIWLCGTQDVTWGRPDLNKTIPKDPKEPIILLAHEPDYADYVSHHPRGRHVDLMLSGHSHGGQVRLPLVGPINLPMLGKKYVEGMFQIEKMQLYVNRGIGSVGLPFRLNCPAEITEFTLQRA